MTYIIDTRSKRHLPAKLAGALAISTLLVLGTFVASASAENRGHPTRHSGGHYGGRGRGGGYYSAPPVVYGSPYDGSYYGSPYDPPPVVYGPGIGIGLPGVGISIW
jgi:hypothetical protein